jgi:hypothetical protein
LKRWGGGERKEEEHADDDDDDDIEEEEEEDERGGKLQAGGAAGRPSATDQTSAPGCPAHCWLISMASLLVMMSATVVQPRVSWLRPHRAGPNFWG